MREFLYPSTVLATLLFGLFGILTPGSATQPFPATAQPATVAALGSIDREALVRRHTVLVKRVDPESPLSVGNGDFAFTVDVTGLQSFESLYHSQGIPLETLSTWAWHSFPNKDGVRMEDAMIPYNFHGRTIRYAGNQNSPAGAYFRENPHPIALGQISFRYKDRPLSPADLTEIDQSLDLWTGLIRSTYVLDGKRVTVTTVAHADASQMAARVESELLQTGALTVHFRFPYSYEPGTRNKPPFNWNHSAHKTRVVAEATDVCELERTLDDSRYFVRVAWTGQATFDVSAAETHDFALRSKGADRLEFVCTFSPSTAPAPTETFDAVAAASVSGWKRYWTEGGVVDFTGSTDPRAAELERRVVLSLYLVKVNYAGHFPPAEDGLTNVTWFGKHNSEMYFWHSAHFYQWGRTEYLEKGLVWYRKILPLALADAREQGFEGARWPKMAGIDGRPSPGTINPFIIWNQPNPIALCELVYRAKPTPETLKTYQELVFESAKFLASFAHLDVATGRYVLGPPIRNVSESSGENLTQNPTFELAYWHYGLAVAQKWRERLGQPPEPKWADILARLSPLPEKNGMYLEIETVPELYEKTDGERLPTSMLMILGFMPKTPIVDLEKVRRTFHEVTRRNGLQEWVSWAMGQAALTATRLNEPETAVAILTNQAPAARFMNNGHVRRPKEPTGCPAYLPVNVSLLNAVGVMAGGWEDAPAGPAPGFPKNGKWVVRAEGMNRSP